LEKIRIVSIGPFTADELKNFNVKNSISEVHTILGSFDTLKEILLH
jgi:uroporphyrinogen-III synthase